MQPVFRPCSQSFQTFVHAGNISLYQLLPFIKPNPIPFINISVIQHLIPLPNDFYIPVLVLQPNHRHHRISLFPLLAAKLHIFLYPYHSIIHNPYFPYIKTLNYLLFICYNITPPTPLQGRIQTHQTTTMRNTLCEFLKLSRQSPRSHASMDFGSLLA